MDNGKIYNYVKKYGIFYIPFLLFLILLRLSPMMYDGWEGPEYYKQHGGLIQWIIYTFGEYRTWINGRVGSNIICGVLESFKSEIVLDITAALMFVGILICTALIIDDRKLERLNWKTAMIFSCAIFLLPPYEVRTYVVQIASISYCMPILLMMVSIILFEQYTKSSNKKFAVIIWIISFFASSWMENQSFAYGCIITILCLKNLWQTRKIDIWLWVSVAVSLISGLIMVTAPGIHINRIDVPGAEPFLVFSWQRVHQHLVFLFNALIYNNVMGNILCFIIFAMFSIWKMQTDKKHIVIHLMMTVVNLGVILLLLQLGRLTNLFNYTADIGGDCYYWLSTLWQGRFLIGAVIGYLLWLAVYVAMISTRCKYIKYIFLFGLISLGIMFPTNQCGDRIYSPILFVNIIIVTALTEIMHYAKVKNAGLTKAMNIVLVVVIMIGLDYYGQLCTRLYHVGKERNVRIEELKNSQFLGECDLEKNYEIPCYNKRDAYLGGEVYVESIHYKSFLNYYSLDANTKVVFLGD